MRFPHTLMHADIASRRKSKKMVFDFGLDEGAYFWFAFVFANLIWLVVPLKLGWAAFARGSQ